MKNPATEKMEYLAYRLTAFIVRILPRQLVLTLGTVLGRLFFRIDKRHRELTQRNLQETLGSGRVAKRVFEHFGRIALDSIKMWGRSPEWIRRNVQVEGEENLRDALRKGGVILFTAHYGNWELGAIHTAVLFGPILVIARALDNRILDRHLRVMRERFGNTVVEKRESARPAMRALQSGRIVAILIDQRVPASEGVPGRFLDRPVSTTPAAGKLALQTGATLIPGFCEPIPGTQTYRSIYLPPVETQRHGIPRPIEEIVQDCNDMLSARIRQRPDLWLWMHDRFRTD